MDERYCQTCDRFRPSHVEEREHEFSVRGETITVRGPVRICAVCGEIMGDEELDGALLKKAYDTYRLRYGMLMSEEIKSIRLSTGLSPEDFGRLFGSELLPYAEKGGLQSPEIDRLLRRFRDDPEFRRSVLGKGTVRFQSRL